VYPHGTRDAWGTFDLLALFASILVIWLWGAFSEASVRRPQSLVGPLTGLFRYSVSFSDS